MHENSNYGYHFEAFSEYEHTIFYENANVKMICPSDGNGFPPTCGRMVDRFGRHTISAFMKLCSYISQVVVLTKNAKLSNEDRFAEILVELYGIEWDIVLFTEMRMQSETLEL